ncbi:MAG: PD-(D/E)XK nuclease family protein, partial [Burkholderiaceae bacterium]
RVWETPQILPFAAFVAKLHDSAQHDPELTGVRVPLTAPQERAIWESIVADNELGLLSSSAAAQLAASAWSLAHHWGIASRLRRYAATDAPGADARIFAEWAGEYGRRVDALDATDLARLPDVVRKYLASGAIDPPPTIVLAGFNETSAQQQALIDALVARGAACERLEPAPHIATPLRAACLDQNDETARMADWVAARLGANQHARIGVVVPNLEVRRGAVTAALDDALLPDRLLDSACGRPYTVSLGGALGAVPLVAFMLRAIRLLLGEVSFEEASSVLRAPYLADAVSERDARDMLDARLRVRAQRRIALDAVVDAAERAALESSLGTPLLLNHLRSARRWAQSQGRRSRRPSEWAIAITHALNLLTAAGAAGPSLDSSEYQALRRWHELLAEFAALDRVVARLTPVQAVAKLEHLARQTTFQPDGGMPPVQVLGMLEANGLDFDHLWIVGLTADAWPGPAHPHPLLPVELQRAVGMPGASASIELARARQQLLRFVTAAPEVIVSHATRDGDRKVGPSALIASFPAYEFGSRAARFTDSVRPIALQSQRDATAPVWVPTVIRGGAAILKDQSACAFRAFATHRLDARGLELAVDGFSASERGQLVHDVLAHFWREMAPATHEALVTLSLQQRHTLLVAAADAALSRLRRRSGVRLGALAQLESARLVRVAEQWLQYELGKRSGFRVVSVEEARAAQVGPLTFTARPDRIDELLDGARLVIDYKTGVPIPGTWLDERPDEPQLPLYLVALEPDARAISFARVRAGDLGMTGLAADPSTLPGRSMQWSARFASWPALVSHWSAVLERIATEFGEGRAAVEPKRGAQTCRYCELATLCRVNERGGVVDVVEVDSAADAGIAL